MKTDLAEFPEIEKIWKEVELLKNRVTTLESSFKNISEQEILAEKSDIAQIYSPDEQSISDDSEESIEFRVGELGMAWLGNIVLLFGIAFLVQYLQKSGYQLFSALIGFISVAAIYTGSYYSRKSLTYLSKLFDYSGHLLLFYMVLRLHFFQAEPLISSKTLALSLLIVTLSILFYLSYLKKSQLMAGIVLLMMLITGIISNSVQLIAAITTLVSILTIILYYRFGWLNLVFIFIFLVYLCHFDWSMNNPFLGNKIGVINSLGVSYYYIFITGFIFSFIAILPKKEKVSNDSVVSAIVCNGLGFTFILALTVFTYFRENYVPIFSALAFVCLAYAILLNSRSSLKITASMYALYGFLAMSIAFYGILLFPKVFMLLAIQSLVVVSMALWFRSRFIVVMNTILFIFLMVLYLQHKSSNDLTNFSFMLVAFITARIINWKKERLNIKTELIRNLYLFFGFIMTLIAFYKAMPPSLITVSWIGAALMFFILGRLIKNIKYRWLAISILVTSAIRLIFYDMSDIDIGFRVLVFLLLAVISIAVSILYTKYLITKK